MTDYIGTPVILTGSPVILNNTLFLNYGGKTGTSTSFAMNAAFCIAEDEVISHLNTPLQPMNLTGTYLWSMGNPFQMDYGYVNSILGVSVFNELADTYTFNASQLIHEVFIRNAKFGQIDIGITCYPFLPYKVNVTYNAGLPSSIYSSPDFLWCLVMAAQLVLNEMSVDGFLANETPGGVGVQSFSNNSYSEKRVTLGNSIFGSSPTAQQITKQLAKYRARSVGRFRR